jgi:DNA-binding protein H-NS
MQKRGKYMALLTLAEAAKLTGRNPSTITRAVQKGKVSCSIDENNQRAFDPVELERAFGKLRSMDEMDAPVHDNANALESTRLHEEVKAMHEREITLMREQIALVKSQLEDVQNDRDHWRNHAERSTLLLEDLRQKEAAKAEQPVAKKKGWFW